MPKAVDFGPSKSTLKALGNKMHGLCKKCGKLFEIDDCYDLYCNECLDNMNDLEFEQVQEIIKKMKG